MNGLSDRVFDYEIHVQILSTSSKQVRRGTVYCPSLGPAVRAVRTIANSANTDWVHTDRIRVRPRAPTGWKMGEIGWASSSSIDLRHAYIDEHGIARSASEHIQPWGMLRSSLKSYSYRYEPKSPEQLAKEKAELEAKEAELAKKKAREAAKIKAAQEALSGGEFTGTAKSSNIRGAKYTTITATTAKEFFTDPKPLTWREEQRLRYEDQVDYYYY